MHTALFRSVLDLLKMIPECSPHTHTHSSPSTAALLPAPVGWTRLMKSCTFPSGNGEQPRLEGELRRACPWATWAYRTTDESSWGPRNSSVSQEVREGMLAHHSHIVKVTLGAQEPLLPSLRGWRWHPCSQHLQNFLLRSGTQEPPLLETEVHRGHLIPPPEPLECSQFPRVPRKGRCQPWRHGECGSLAQATAESFQSTWQLGNWCCQSLLPLLARKHTDDDLGQCRCKWRGLHFKVPRKRRTNSRRSLGSAGGFMSDVWTLTVDVHSCLLCLEKLKKVLEMNGGDGCTTM